jgi:oxalate decarboxylase family bicupin protein
METQGPIWYSFDLARKRVEEGGWTHQVTQRELPPSTELAGVNMRITRGSFRELHWHTADEWAIMIPGNARVTVLNPDGTMFIDDVTKGDLWFFPAGYPHSIQGLGPDDVCEFLLVFDQGMFSEDNTFLISAWLAHTPPEMRDVAHDNNGRQIRTYGRFLELANRAKVNFLKSLRLDFLKFRVARRQQCRCNGRRSYHFLRYGRSL